MFDYTDAARSYLDRPAAEFPLFHGVMTGWDNTPRRQRRGYVFRGSTPERYRAWLAETVRQTRAQRPEGSRLVFINAWNEWAEGAHLEPDQRHGRAYLEATRDALTESHLPDGSRSPLELVHPALLDAEATALQRLDEFFAREESEIRWSERPEAARLLEQPEALHALKAETMKIVGEEIQRAVEEGRVPAPGPREIGPLAFEAALLLSRGLNRLPAIKGGLRTLLRRILWASNARG